MLLKHSSRFIHVRVDVVLTQSGERRAAAIHLFAAGATMNEIFLRDADVELAAGALALRDARRNGTHARAHQLAARDVHDHHS